MQPKIVSRVTKTNRAAIESDARVALPDDTAIDLTDTCLFVNGPTPFAGMYRIVRYSTKPRWIGDNGYGFERDLNAADTLRLNDRPYSYDNGARNAIEARINHFIELVERYHLDDDLLASARGSIEAATSAAEVRSLGSLIEYLSSGYAVAAFTEAYEAALARHMIAEAPAFAHRCQYCGAIHTADVELDHVYCEVARRPIEVVCVKRPAVVPPAPAEHAERRRVINRALDSGRKYTDDQVAQYPLLRAVAIDFVRTYRGTNGFVQDIAIKLVDNGTLSTAQLRGALNVMIAEARIELDAELAIDAAYNASRAPVAPRATTGEYLAAVAAAETRSGIDRPFMDLRRQSDKDIEAAGDAIPAEAERANEVEPAIPNGVYTVLLDDAGKTYRTLRVKTPPDHFTVKPGTQLIEFLNGPDNGSDYAGFAFLAGRRVSIWSRFKTADALRQAADRLVADPMTAAREYVKRSNRCFVCNRPLTTPESIDRGIGPICAEQIGAMGFVLALRGDKDSAAEENDARDRLAQADKRAADHDKRASLARIERLRNQPSPAENALRRARARQAAAGPISAEQAQADIDELFPE